MITNMQKALGVVGVTVFGGLVALWMRRDGTVEGVKEFSDDKASEHFSYAELSVSSTADRLGLDNEPGGDDKAWLVYLAQKVLEPLREEIGAIQITSGFRSQEVNDAIGGSKTSDHRFGKAVDLYSNGETNQEIALVLWALRDKLPLDQVIVEKHTGHLHLGTRGKDSRGQFLQFDGSDYSDWSPTNT